MSFRNDYLEVSGLLQRISHRKETGMTSRPIVNESARRVRSTTSAISEALASLDIQNRITAPSSAQPIALLPAVTLTEQQHHPKPLNFRDIGWTIWDRRQELKLAIAQRGGHTCAHCGGDFRPRYEEPCYWCVDGIEPNAPQDQPPTPLSWAAQAALHTLASAPAEWHRLNGLPWTDRQALLMQTPPLIYARAAADGHLEYKASTAGCAAAIELAAQIVTTSIVPNEAFASQYAEVGA